MEVLRLYANQYRDLFPSPLSLFNSTDFSELNSEKCVSLHYLAFKSGKVRLGIILGEKEKSFCVPFSASYGGFSFNSAVSIQHYYEACECLRHYIHQFLKPLYVTLAPPIYDESDNAKTLKALINAGAQIVNIDYNHYFDLSYFGDYNKIIDSTTRNKLNKALTSGLQFDVLEGKNYADIVRVYSVIMKNHQERNHPLRMSLTNVVDTLQIIPSDLFVVTDNDGTDIAAALIYHTSKTTYQVVYWGNITAYKNLYAMNFLAYKLFEYYSKTEVKKIDIGISTEEGEPNFGLCEFKENIGCKAVPRFTLVIE